MREFPEIVKASVFPAVHILMSLVSLLTVASAVASAQSRFPMRYLDQVGYLGTELDNRESVDVGLVRVFPDGGNLRFEGKDRDGNPWRFWIAKPGLVGFTDVWTADFDRNGLDDLLIAPFMPQNGRCAFNIEVAILLFDSSGRPTGWGVATQMPDTNTPTAPPYRPILIADLNRDGSAEFVSVKCEYADRPGLATDWTITGVYEARDTRIISLRRPDVSPYEGAAKQAYPQVNQLWLPMRPDAWPELQPLSIE